MPPEANRMRASTIGSAERTPTCKHAAEAALRRIGYSMIALVVGTVMFGEGGQAYLCAMDLAALVPYRPRGT